MALTQGAEEVRGERGGLVRGGGGIYLLNPKPNPEVLVNCILNLLNPAPLPPCHPPLSSQDKVLFQEQLDLGTANLQVQEGEGRGRGECCFRSSWISVLPTCR